MAKRQSAVARREEAEPHAPCMELTSGEARYLLALRDLSRSTTSMSQAAVARHVGVSHPTALEMIRRLRAMGLVEAGGLDLTAGGTSAALVLSSRRHAAHLLAHDVLGLDDQQATVEAEALATNVSPLLARRLVAWRAARDSS